MAPPHALCTGQVPVRGQDCGVSTQRLSTMPPSMTRTTSSREISDAGRANRMPPPMPRAVARMPAFARRPTMRRTKGGGRSRWAAILWHVVEGTHSMGRSVSFPVAAVVSLLFLGLQVVPVYVLAVGYGIHLTWGAAAVILVILRLGSIPPQAPSNVGAFQFFTVVALELFGTTKADAAGYATLLFIVVTVPLWIGGFLALIATRMRLHEIHHHAHKHFAASKEARRKSENGAP